MQPQRVLVPLEIPKRIVLDTTVLIRHLLSRKEDSLVNKLEGSAHLAITMVNLFELYLGAYKSKDARRNVLAVNGLRATLPLLSLTDGSAEKAGKILAEFEDKGRTIDSRDIFIGAISLEEGFAVLTDNTEHFRRIPRLEVVSEKEILRNAG